MLKDYLSKDFPERKLNFFPLKDYLEKEGVWCWTYRYGGRSYTKTNAELAFITGFSSKKYIEGSLYSTPFEGYLFESIGTVLKNELPPLIQFKDVEPVSNEDIQKILSFGYGEPEILSKEKCSHGIMQHTNHVYGLFWNSHSKQVRLALFNRIIDGERFQPMENEDGYLSSQPVYRFGYVNEYIFSEMINEEISAKDKYHGWDFFGESIKKSDFDFISKMMLNQEFASKYLVPKKEKKQIPIVYPKIEERKFLFQVSSKEDVFAVIDVRLQTAEFIHNEQKIKARRNPDFFGQYQINNGSEILNLEKDEFEVCLSQYF